MTAQRRLSPFETNYFSPSAKFGSVPTSGMPLFIGSTVHGRLDIEILRRVLDELAAAHPLLRSRVVTDADGTMSFHRDDRYRPRFDITEGDEVEYVNLVNTQQDWRDGLFRAHLLRGDDRDQLVLVIHHGIADGRSAFALLAQLWRQYTAHAAGTPLPQPDSDQGLPEAIDNQLATVVSDIEIDALLDEVRSATATMSPESAPRALPKDGDGLGDDPLGRLALQRIELDAEETASFVGAARAQGISVNSLLTAAAMIAFRSRLEGDAGPLPLFCGHAVDLRSEANLPVGTILNCSSGAGTYALVAEDSNPIDVGSAVAAAMQAATDRLEAACFLLAGRRDLDEMTAAILAAAPTLAISNIGRLPAHSMPDDIRNIRVDVYAMSPGMPPKLTAFTVGGRLTIQVEYDTALYSRTQMGKITLALIEQIQRCAAVADE
ncbi:phthiocerol/phthiodiolone dimycocerosyl transferase family protein [Nocardia sp. KC 131]|uniref:phthiocerol/phthiodiolone dimycocerosyl transferase family protein n=1 Tax=Nocardia arseniciresistens TaxID=3392119 RepID=UPI00398EA750